MSLKEGKTISFFKEIEFCVQIRARDEREQILFEQE